MKLNMAIIKDYLQQITILEECIKNPYEFHLIEPRFYQGGELQNNYLYLVGADAEIDPIFINCQSSVLYLKGIKRICSEGEYICLEEQDIYGIFNQLTEIFHRFQTWEIKILTYFTQHCSFHAIGEILFEIVQNPVSFCTPVLKIEMLVTDDVHPLPDNYAMVENMYLSTDEHEVVLTDPEYRDTLKKREPDIFSSTMYGFRKLYYNILHNKEYLGRVVIDEIYQECKKSDLSILVLFSEYIKTAYLNKCCVELGDSQEFNIMIRKLTIENNVYLEKYDFLLKLRGWKKSDHYICVCFQSTSGVNYYSRIIDDTIYLHRIFDSNCAFTDDKNIIVLLNLGNGETIAGLYNRLEYFLQKYQYMAGVSNVFCSFDKVNLYYRQAAEALKIGLHIQSPGKLIKYKDYILDYIIMKILEENEREFYFSEQFKLLKEYDDKKKTELVFTLQVCLECNMNASLAQEILHVHRTTYLYRIRRIKEISGIDLANYKNRLFLMLLFELIKSK